jgi:hypothetical protein
MYLTFLRPFILHRFQQQLWTIRSCIRTLTDTYIAPDQVKIFQEEETVPSIIVVNDPLMQSIQSCSSLSILFPLVRANLPQHRAQHIAAALLRACNIVRSCAYFHPINMEIYRKKLLDHPIFDLLCHLCEHRLLELNFEDHINIMSSLVKLDIRMSSSESPFLRHLFTELAQIEYIEKFDLNLLNRFLIALVKKSNRHLRKFIRRRILLYFHFFSSSIIQTIIGKISSIINSNWIWSYLNNIKMYYWYYAFIRCSYSII